MVNKKNNPPACSPHQPHLSAEDFPSLQSKDTLPELIYKRYLNIKHNDPNMKMTDLNPFDVERKLKTVLGKRHTCKVSTTRSGLLLIEVDRKEIVDKLLKTTKIGDIPVTISENVILNSSKGIVYCDNEEVKKMTDDQIKKEIENQNVTHVYRIKKRTGPKHTNHRTSLLLLSAHPFYQTMLRLDISTQKFELIIQTRGGASTVNVTVTGRLTAHTTLYAQNVAKKVMSTRIVKMKSVAIIVDKTMKHRLENAPCLSWRNSLLRKI